MKGVFLLCALLLLCISIEGQDTTKPWTEWSKKDVEKLLNDSPWAQAQTVRPEAPADAAAITRTQGAGNESVNRAGQSGETLGGGKPFYYRARLLTAKPVREAFGRLVLLAQPTAGKELTEQLQGFVDRDFGDFIVVALNVDGPDAKGAAAAMAVLGKLKTEVLKDKVFLERKDGKRMALVDYRAPVADGMGGKFIFARKLDGQPFLTDASESFRFAAEFSEKMKLNIRFKVAGMQYGSRLEY